MPSPCPHCSSTNIKLNGKKLNGKQNYYCKNCRKHFLSASDYQQPTRKKDVLFCIARSLVNGASIRGIRAIFGVSYYTIYKILKSFKYSHKSKQPYYDTLEIDEFWTFIGCKKRKPCARGERRHRKNRPEPGARALKNHVLRQSGLLPAQCRAGNALCGLPVAHHQRKGHPAE